MVSAEKLDKYFFELINGHWHNDFFDLIMPLIRSPQLWLPLYFFLLIWQNKTAAFAYKIVEMPKKTKKKYLFL